MSYLNILYSILSISCFVENASVGLPNFKYLDNALPELEKFNVSLYMTYCEEDSRTNLCQLASTTPSIALFK